jgi:hypothetical protein
MMTNPIRQRAQRAHETDVSRCALDCVVGDFDDRCQNRLLAAKGKLSAFSEVSSRAGRASIDHALDLRPN